MASPSRFFQKTSESIDTTAKLSKVVSDVSPVAGEYRFAYAYQGRLPGGWIRCDGGEVPSDMPALAELLGTTFDSEGARNLLPDLRDAVPMGLTGSPAQSGSLGVDGVACGSWYIYGGSH